jgi:hypothetical protein
VLSCRHLNASQDNRYPHLLRQTKYTWLQMLSTPDKQGFATLPFTRAVSTRITLSWPDAARPGAIKLAEMCVSRLWRTS